VYFRYAQVRRLRNLRLGVSAHNRFVLLAGDHRQRLLVPVGTGVLLRSPTASRDRNVDPNRASRASSSLANSPFLMGVAPGRTTVIAMMDVIEGGVSYPMRQKGCCTRSFGASGAP
jgi:hypothetical protein